MGWFSSGPNINTRVVGNKEQFYGTCPDCRDEHTGRREKDVRNQMDSCARKAKREKEDDERKLKAKQRKAELDQRKQKLKEANARQEEKERRERERQADALRSKMTRGIRQRRRAAKGKCPWCKSQPCKGTKPECAKTEAARLQSSMHMLDASDPARFDEQLRIAREMGL